MTAETPTPQPVPQPPPARPKSKSRKGKADAERSRRTAAVRAMLEAGKSLADIRAALAEEFGRSPRGASADVDRALDEIANDNPETRRRRAARARLRYERCPRAAWEVLLARVRVRWSTAENAANLRPGYVEELRAAYPDRLARQELDACFESFRGAVFPEFRRAPAPEGNLLPWEFRPGSAAWVGIDFGFRRPAAVWVAPAEGDTFVIVDEFLGEDCPVQRLAAEIRSRPFRLLGAFGDPAGAGRHGSGDSDLRTLRDAGIPVAVCTDPQRTRLMFGIGLLQGLLLSAEGRRRLFLAVDGTGRCRVPGVMAALESYAWPESRPGRPVAEEPVKDGVHDHPLDALRYWAINHLRPPAALTGRCGVR